MANIKFPKKQEQRLIPKYLLEYAEELQENHPDPSASWGGGSGGSYTAGTGIDIESNVISVDDTVAMKTDIPDVSDFVTSTELSTELADYELKSEAFSGSYNDLSNKPDLTVYELKSEAFSGNYNDLTNKPSIPTKTSDLTNDSGYITGVTWNDVTNKPTFATVATTGDYDDLTNKPTIPDAVSGTNDGTNWTTITIGNTTKNIPTGGGTTYTAGTWIGITNDTINVSNPYISLLDGNNLPRVMISDHTNGTTPTFTNAKYCNISPLGFGINDRTKTAPTGGPASNTYTYYNWDKITFDGTWDLALPNKSGTLALTSDIITSYNDLTDKPTIPTVGDGTITIKKNNTTVDTFTTNQSANKSINITVPTKTSELTNNSGFITGITSSDVITALGYTPGTSNFSGDYDDLTDKPIIPTDVVVIELAENASGTLSASELTQVTTDPIKTLLHRGTVYYALTGVGTTNIRFTSSNGFTSAATWYTILVNKTNGNWTYETKTQNYISMSDFATVATSGDYDDLLNKPTIPTVPTNVSAFTNDAGYITNSVNNLTNYTLSSSLATVATSGSYNDLSNKPTIPDVYYKNNDSFAFNTYANLYGYLTSAGKTIQFSVTTPKLLTNVTSITVDNLYAVIRGVAGYVNGSSYIDYANTTGYTVTAYKATDNMITIVVDATNAYSSGTNNTPISLAFNPSSNNALKLTFNT